jgi:hypothetical protein
MASGVRTIEDRVTPAVTVSDGDCSVAPFSDAVMVAVPAATPVTVTTTADTPPATVADAGKVATAGLLLVSAMVVAAAATALSRTVP